MDELLKARVAAQVAMKMLKNKHEQFKAALEALKTLRTDIEEERKEVPGADGKPTALDTALKAAKIVKVEKFNFCDKDDARHIGIELENGIKVHNLYIPAGGDLPDTKLNPKFEHKINFLSEIKDKYFKGEKKKTIIAGDFNIAPLPDDVWSHKTLLSVVSHTKIETDLLSEIILL